MFQLIAGETPKGDLTTFLGAAQREGKHLLAVYVRGGASAEESFIMVGRLASLKGVARRGTGRPDDIEWRLSITNLHFELGAGDVLRLYDPVTEEVDIFLGRVGASGKLSTGQRVSEEDLDYVRKSVLGGALPFRFE